MPNQVRDHLKTKYDEKYPNPSFPGCLDGRSASTEQVCTEQKAYLFRTNYHLFNTAVQLIVDKGLKDVGFVGVSSEIDSSDQTYRFPLGQKCNGFRQNSRYFFSLA